jgi:cysteine synthase
MTNSAYKYIAIMASVSLSIYILLRQPRKGKRKESSSGIVSLIGNTPLIRINSLSEATGCEILAKVEFINVGGSPKDRVALGMVMDAEADKLITPNTGCTLFEGTVGSTGISLATIAKAKGYNCHIVMPDDVASEKYELLIKLGATVERVRPCSIVDSRHFVNIARRRAEEMNILAEKDPACGRG